MLFARSIRENLQVGRPGRDRCGDDRGARARPGASSSSTARPRASTPSIGERGRSLSGGERQRLSIARALLKNPPILILDEATSALDAATERKLQLALDEVMKGRTTFVIAHRLATIRNADRILVFDQGRIIETGTFDELVAKGGRFAELAKAQFMAAEEPREARQEAQAAHEPRVRSAAAGCVGARVGDVTLRMIEAGPGGRTARHPAARLSGILVGMALSDRSRWSNAGFRVDRAGPARLQSQRRNR